ncbi:MAG: heavy-metal-associated domain-containing protein [Desulfomonile sp.]|nr:heavy-metal-associated domain-containing protein [Desulfomonile sp.]
MSEKREMKQINIETLEQAERKVSVGNVKKFLFSVIAVLVLSGGGYAAYRLVAGDVIASKFTVTNMTCPACVVTVKDAASKVPGVVDSDVSLAAQTVTITFREKQTNPEQIRDAIARAGYPSKLDALFRPSGEGIDEKIVATVNGRPVFARQLKVPVNPDEAAQRDADTGEAFFSVVGRELILQFADTKTVTTQPHEVEEEIESLRKKFGISAEEIARMAAERYGSLEKFLQVVAQRIAIRKLVMEYVAPQASDPTARESKVIEWIGGLFKDADVRVVDPQFREQLHASSGESDWKKLWPRMISRNTELRAVVLQ